MRSRWLAPFIVLISLLSACGSTEENPSSSAPAGSDGGDKNASSGSTDEKPTVEIVDSGFGQSDCCTQGIVIATTDSEAAIAWSGEDGVALVRVTDAGLAIDAAAAGLGRATVPELLARRDLAQARVRLIGESQPSKGGYWLVAPLPQWRQKKVRALVDALTA